MSSGLQIALLPDGRRLHLQHGPIDLIVEAFGAADEVAAAYRQAAVAFDGLLEGLIAELAVLRVPMGGDMPEVSGPVAARMVAAVRPHAHVFITPMAAVAGAVADHVLSALIAGRALRRAYVNNGGDIALYLGDGERFDAGIAGAAGDPSLDGVATVTSDMPVRGIATSGRGGRSLSLGIADAVTVLAECAAAADAAATLIANAVDVAHPAIERRPAFEVDDMTDLGDRLVPVSVGALDDGSVKAALATGTATADDMVARQIIEGAVLMLAGRARTVGAGRSIGARQAA